jgi:hypothetical protein
VHPTLLQNISKLVRHIVRLKKQIFEAAATTPNANMAKDIYTDLFGSLGVDIEALQPVLMNLLQDASKAHGEPHIPMISGLLMVGQTTICVSPSLSAAPRLNCRIWL